MILGFRHPPLMRLAERRARRHLETQVADPVLRAKLTPDYSLGCKRILLSDNYLPALTRPNVAVDTDGIREITENGVVDGAGVEHLVDAIILGTGFDTLGLPLTDRIHDADGVSMADRWAGDPVAYLGTAVAGYPNCFLIHGPNIGTGHNSVLQMLESEAAYIASAIGYAEEQGLGAVQPTEAAQEAYAAEIDRMSEGTVWTAGGCRSWYLNENGRNVNIWPGTTFDFRRRTRRFEPAAHLMEKAGQGRAERAARVPA
jgi:cation diffusion facilitator CzcD-associated flavoprotein CzcO